MAQIAQIIKYEGDNNTFVWKHPKEDFNSLTQLIVHESQEAIFFMNGQALDLFGPGRYTLETQNIPLLGKLLNLTTGGSSPFHCEVYFINKTVKMSIKWGTDRKVRFIEPTMGLPLEIGACGEMNLQVADSRKLLVQLVGTTNGIAWEKGDTVTRQGLFRTVTTDSGFTKSLQACFRPMISTAIKTHLAGTIKAENINILEIDQHLELLSEGLRRKINPSFEEYGLTVPQLYITSVALPEDDLNFRKMKELHTLSLQTKLVEAETRIKTAQADSEAAITAARRKIELERQTTETEVTRQEAERELIRAQADAQAARMAGFAEAEVMQVQGYNQKDVLQADVQKAYAAGLGQMGQVLQGFQPTPAAATVRCASCGAVLPEGAKFCLECGQKVIPADRVICPVCGNAVVKGKFCPECGHKFQMACPHCGAALTGGKFCPECGEKL